MAGFKINRITSDIKIALSELLREVKDPRVSKLLSIVKVDVSGDLSYATVYVSAIEGYEATVNSVKALKEFQNKHGLEADGICGKKTREELKK
jgi:ribosome-binding factor A